jgi:hypothetical protein
MSTNNYLQRIVKFYTGTHVWVVEERPDDNGEFSRFCPIEIVEYRIEDQEDVEVNKLRLTRDEANGILEMLQKIV